MAQPSSQGRKVALITGVTGQDGSYLTELLLEKGYVVDSKADMATTCSHNGSDYYAAQTSLFSRSSGRMSFLRRFSKFVQVHGMKRRSSSYNHPRLEHILDSSKRKARASTL